jgi:acetylornithine deacetylase/succinyl-diaminopimelate desuccinylase-like protein
MAGWVAEYLRRIGADVETPLLAPGRPNVVAVFEPTRRAEVTIAFVPHLDTVAVDGMTVPPFSLTRRGTRLHGRGACDTKGPMAALFWALRRWTRSPAARRTSVRWIVAATAGEEQGGLGAQALLERGFRPDFAVALEPTELKVVHAAKGLLRVGIEVPGRAAHGSKPQRGINAIFRALPLLQALRDEVGPALTSRRHPVFGGATLNLGTMTGGSVVNIVPALCRLELDVRLHPRCSAEDALALLKGAIRRHLPVARLQIHRRGPAFLTDRSNPWAHRLRRVGRGWAVADWFCDANFFSDYGIPSVAFGPGNIRQAHTCDEFIDATQLAAGENAFFHYLVDAPSAKTVGGSSATNEP